uniref:Ankyrin repeat protein n=1 Tax=Pfiesteria piscicida TaxID=71001 RepID=A3E3K2_PFIPI|nr:ankyrin repeat protein [Pfiesteria piscicida]
MGAAAAGPCKSEDDGRSNELLCAPACTDDVLAGFDAAAAKCQAHVALDECVPVRMQGLSDQACADVLLVQAAQRGDVQDLHRAISNGAHVDTCANLCLSMGEAAMAKPTGITPLMRASACGHQDVILQLLQARANPAKGDARRWTPLCHALANGELEAARLLMAHVDNVERQKGVANALRKHLPEVCEETAGADKARDLEAMFHEGGPLMMDASRRV